MFSSFVDTPHPPYVAAIFSPQWSEDSEVYAEMATKMYETALHRPGCLGAETAEGPNGFGITATLFTDAAVVSVWKNDVGRLAAQRLGKERCYDRCVRVAKVEKTYFGPAGR